MLPTALKVFSILSALGGFIQCIALWPRRSNLSWLLDSTQFGYAAYSPAITYLVAGALSACVLWAVGEALEHIRGLVALQEYAAQQAAATGSTTAIEYEPEPTLEEGQWRCRCGFVVNGAIYDHCPKCGRAPDAII